MTDYDTADHDTSPVDWMDLGLQCPELMGPVLSPCELATERLHCRDLADDLHWCVAWELVTGGDSWAFGGMEAYGPIPSVAQIARQHEYTVEQVRQAMKDLVDVDALTIYEPTDRWPKGRYIFDIKQLDARMDFDNLITDQPVLVLPEPKRPPVPRKRLPWLTGLVLAVLGVSRQQ